MRDDRSVGTLRLPDHRAEEFVAHFNRTYEAVGLEITVLDFSELDSIQPKVVPGNLSVPTSAGNRLPHGKTADETNVPHARDTGREPQNGLETSDPAQQG